MERRHPCLRCARIPARMIAGPLMI